MILSGWTCVEVADEGVEAVAASLEVTSCDVLTVVEKCLEVEIRREGAALGAVWGWAVVDALFARKRDVEWLEK